MVTAIATTTAAARITTTDKGADVTLTVLSDNRSIEPARFHAEHGLSILLETEGLKILLDTGASESYIRNAGTLGINLADVDYVFLSHGHRDHTGGLASFLHINAKAKVIVSPYAVKHAFYSTSGSLHSITANWPLAAMEGRCLYAENNLNLPKGIRILANLPQTEPTPRANQSLMLSDSRQPLQPDPFRHELALFINGLLFTGCAHNGLMNILSAAPAPVHTVVGGFHLPDTGEGRHSETDEEIRTLGEKIAATYPDIVFYTGHCTGNRAFSILKQILGGRLHLFSCGMQLPVSPFAFPA